MFLNKQKLEFKARGKLHNARTVSAARLNLTECCRSNVENAGIVSNKEVSTVENIKCLSA